MRNIALMILLAAAAFDAAAAVPSEIAPNVFLLRGEFVPGRQPDGNTILFVQKNGIVAVDTGRHAAHTRAILDFASAQKKPLRAVINTHWHLDHIGGNALVRREVPKAKIYASGTLDDALKGFLANYAKQLEAMIVKSNGEERERYATELALIQGGDKLKPDVVVAKSGRHEGLQINLEKHAATAGDLWILDAKTGTLAAGDLVTLPFPFLDTACPRGWQKSLARIAAADFDLLVPGHGAPMTRKEFDRYRLGFDHLLACGASDKPIAQCADGWIADAGVAESEQAFVRQALDYYITAFLRPAASTTYCANGIAHVNPGETALRMCSERSSPSITKSISSARRFVS
jgi:glyoxylase-like metal-dependent hydrolase (beta-lactamase superfamily II)